MKREAVVWHSGAYANASARTRAGEERERKDARALLHAPLVARALGLQATVWKTKRKRAIAGQRDVYAYILHTFSDVSIGRIAEHMGADRGTASDWIDAVRRRIDTDDALEAFIDRIGERLRAQMQLRQLIEDDRGELARLFPSGPTAVQLAFRYKVSVAEVAPLVCYARTTSATQWKGGDHKPSKDLSLSRFGTSKPEGGVDLKVNHPALSEGRTIFPTTVVGPRETERLLVSGVNNPKLGAEIRKGPWKGFPIYQLTLEERATCPRSCALWAGCYGNAMHMARRHDHRDADFLVLLEMELLSLTGKNPFGFAVRLHTLGDFYSVEYVEFWEGMLDRLPALHLFGFTAYRALASDERECQIGAEIEEMNVAFPKRCFIRFSGEEGAGGSLVFDKAVPQNSEVIMCPAQTDKTTACATCGLCWSPNAWERPIGFLRHGMKGRRPRKSVSPRHNPSKIDEKPAVVADIDAAAEISASASYIKNDMPAAISVLQCGTKSRASDEVDRIIAEAQKRRTDERIARDIRINEAIVRHAEASGASREARKDADHAREKLAQLHREQSRISR